MQTKKKRAKKPLTPEKKKQLAERKKELAFKKKIRSTFTDAGFDYLPSNGKTFHIGHRDVELDYVFIYDNVILICEDTCQQNNKKDHVLKKSEACKVIKDNTKEFLQWLCSTFPEKQALINKYRPDRYLIYFLYIPQDELPLTDEDRARFDNLVFVEPETLSYFSRMSQCIQRSARYEIFRFLNIKDDQLGPSSSEGGKTTIKAPIIYPDDITGLRNGVRVVSFMMSAEKLLRTAYVLRKDNWEESMYLYQRLIEKEKVKSIRAFLATKGEAFYNNIIVALPDSAKFENDAGMTVTIENIGPFQPCKLVIPDEMNSICVIDGQHRIFAHYEASGNDKYEERIAELRKQLHLLVTGLIFPPTMKEVERKQLQSEIFLDINDNTKKVAANVLTHIEMIKDPFSDIGLARRVIEKLNKKRVFLNRFELSALDENKIKVASIIKFALRYLVTIAPAEGKCSLFTLWNGDKEALLQKDEAALDSYLDFCATELSTFFSALRDARKEDWNDPNSKILSVISINGFIIALNRLLKKNGIADFETYRAAFGKLNISFSRTDFPFTSSQYRKFSSDILREAFGFTDEDLTNT